MLGHSFPTRRSSDLEALRKPVIEGMRELALTIPGLQIWDPFPTLCPGDICRTQADGRPLFFDGDHLSAYGNLKVYASFKQFAQESK